VFPWKPRSGALAKASVNDNRRIFDPKQPAFNYTLEKGQETTIRYRVVIADRAESADELNKEADVSAAEYK
jgi:hypothetical protein